MDSIRQYWTETMELPGARWVVAIFGLISSLLIAVYVVKWFRDLAIGVGHQPISHLAEFERLFAAGTIDEDEFKRLKKTLPQNMKSEMAATLSKIKPLSVEPKKVEPNTKPNKLSNQTDISHVLEATESAEPTFTEIDDQTDS